MPVAVLFVVIVGLPVLIYSFLMFDRIIRFEYETFREEWVDDGSQTVSFGEHPNPRGLKPAWRGTASPSWLFKTPSWAADSKECQDWLKRLRVCVLIWNLLIVSLFLVLMMRAMIAG